MLVINTEYNEINRKLAELKAYVELENASGRTDINIGLENFFCGLFNIIRNSSFYNVNSLQRNFPSIDLADDNSKIAIQITSRRDSKKIKETLDKFESNKLYEKWHLLEIFIVGNKSKDPNLCFNNFNYRILDLKDLVRQISTISDLHQLQSIKNYINNHININENSSNPFATVKPITIPFFNAKAYIEDWNDWSLDSEYGEEISEDLRIFCDSIAKISLSTRQFMSALINNSIKIDYPYIIFDLNYIKNIFSNTHPSVIDNEYTTLVNMKMAEQFLDDRDWDNASWKSRLWFSPNKSSDIELAYIAKFCEDYEINIDRFLIDLDFSILD